MRWRQPARVLTVVAFFAGGVFCSSNAVALTASTVEPSTDLVSGQVVQVTGEGWPPNQLLHFAECDRIVGRCLEDGVVTTDDEGSFTAAYTVQRFIGTAPFENDCARAAGQCVIAIADYPKFDIIEYVDLAFRITARADGIIYRQSDGLRYGDDVYNLNGAGQTRVHAIVPGGKWSFALRVQNDGAETGDITVHAPVPSGNVTVRYFVGYTEVTAAVNGSGFTFHDIAAGATMKIPAQFSAPSDALVGSVTSFVVGFSTNGALVFSDAVSIGVKVTTPT